jgi:hypothetical protein
MLKKVENLTAGALRRRFRTLRQAKKALAIPATFLILFVSLLGVISITYYFAVERVNAGSQALKVSMAKQNMNSLDENVLSVLWQPGSSQIMEFGDCGGTLNVQSSSNLLIINITDNVEIADTLFNANVGQTIYELPYSESADTGLFLKGDSRVILNQSGPPVTQLQIRSGTERAEILLRYRLVTSSTTSGEESNQTINDLRIYIVNLNGSQNIGLMGEVPLRISCSNVEKTVKTYNVTYQTTALAVAAILGGTQGQITVPISSDTNGAIINVELVVCKVTIERWVR